MNIIEATETAILEAVVTTYASSAAYALELAENELRREGRKTNKVVCIPQYKLEDAQEVAGGFAFTFHFGEFTE